MKNKRTVAVVAMAIVVLGGTAAIAQDKYSLKIPDGLAFSEFKGYEKWQVVSVSHPAENSEMSGEVLNVIVANQIMIDAYLSGVPGNGKPFPDGSKTVKIQYIPKNSPDAPPPPVAIPERLRNVAFMAKDSKRFASGNGWGYGVFNYDAKSDKFTPEGAGATCGVGCHTIAKEKNYVFTVYQKR